jgi:hypothetical protein
MSKSHQFCGICPVDLYQAVFCVITVNPLSTDIFVPSLSITIVSNSSLKATLTVLLLVFINVNLIITVSAGEPVAGLLTNSHKTYTLISPATVLAPVI